MKTWKHFIVAAIIGIIGIVTACDNSDGGDGGGSGVDYTNHTANYSILVRNNTDKKLVAFKGDLLDSSLIGGIPAHATNHGLPNDPALFNKTEDFPMILLTEAQYNANKNNLNSQINTPFTRVYVFFSGNNTTVYEIPACLGGNNELRIINASSSINVELRLGSTAGETLGYAPAGILETTLRLQDGDYHIFPVFKKYNTLHDVVETVYPQGTSGAAWYATFSFGKGITSAAMDLNTILQNTTFVLGAAWVYVDNQTSSGGIRFLEGSYVRATASGFTNIMNGNPMTFQIDMPMAGNNYADSITVSDWKFGANGREVALQTGENDTTPLGSLTVERGKMYTITVSGNTDNGLKAWVSNTTDIL